MITYLDTQVATWLVEGQIKKLTVAANAALQRSSLLIFPMVLLEFEFMLEIRRTVIPAIEMAARLKAELYVDVSAAVSVYRACGLVREVDARSIRSFNSGSRAS